MKVLERGIPDDAMVGILNIKVCVTIKIYSYVLVLKVISISYIV
jgi:hypothetical protein